MRVTVFAEIHLARNAEGVVCATGAERYEHWTPYLEVFDAVTIVARLAPGPVDGAEVIGPGVSLHAVPNYTGPSEYLRHYPAVRRAVVSACRNDSAFILRVPGRLGTLAFHELRRRRTPYGAEIIGDPFDTFSPGAVRHPLRPIFRAMFTADLKRQARYAVAALYLTESALQRRYPCPAFHVGVASVELATGTIAQTWKRSNPDQRTFRIVTVGTLAQLYKAPDVLIDALARCVDRGLDVHATFVGGGRFRPLLEAQAAALGLSDRITFRGHLLAGAPVRAELDAADLFVLPSRQEGLPRALVEAMARGLPCIASRVGGIPELLADEDMVSRNDPVGLADRIEAVLTDPARRERMAERNLARARDFSKPLLLDRMYRFYREVQERTRASRASLREERELAAR